MKRAASCLLIAAAILSGCAAKSERTVRIALEGNRFAPESITVKPGERVHFVLVNEDAVDHEFVLGDEEFQREHAKGGGKEMHHELGENSRAVPEGDTVNFVWTAPHDAGELIIGCHVDGHFEAGMRGKLTIT